MYIYHSKINPLFLLVYLKLQRNNSVHTLFKGDTSCVNHQILYFYYSEVGFIRYTHSTFPIQIPFPGSLFVHCGMGDQWCISGKIHCGHQTGLLNVSFSYQNLVAFKSSCVSMILHVLGECTIKLLANKPQEMKREDLKKWWGGKCFLLRAPCQQTEMLEEGYCAQWKRYNWNMTWQDFFYFQ